jgi:glycosyltransferase involved in cell wall biosynthesis
MRVVHVIPDLDPSSGGPAAGVLVLTEHLAQLGAMVTVASSWRGEAPPTAAEAMRRVGVLVELVGPARWPLYGHPAMPGLLTRLVGDADIVHIHALWEDIQHQAAVASRRLGKPYIFRSCGMLAPWSLRRSWLKKKLYMAWRLRRDLNGAAALHYTADAARDGAKVLGLRPPALVVPNGVNLREFDPLPPRGFLRHRYPALADRPVVLFLGRIHPKKGLDLLIPAFAQMRSTAAIDAVLVITGPDNTGYQAAVQKMVGDHHLGDRVIFTGPIYGAGRVAALVDADLFVLPSYQENFGNAVTEALAAGTPVLVSDQVNTCDDVLRHRVGGVVKCQVQDVAEGLTRWLTDVEMRRAAAGRARACVRDHFNWAQIAEHWLGEYRRIIAAHRDAHAQRAAPPPDTAPRACPSGGRGE